MGSDMRQPDNPHDRRLPSDITAAADSRYGLANRIYHVKNNTGSLNITEN